MAQVTALKKLYEGKNAALGTWSIPDITAGAEGGLGRGSLARHRRRVMAFFGNGFFSGFVYEKPDWDYKTFKVDSDLKAASEKTAQALNATDSDPKPFKARGKVDSVSRLDADPAITALKHNSTLPRCHQEDGGRGFCCAPLHGA